MRDWLKSVDKYWFSWGDPASLGLMRIGFGLLTFWSLLILIPDWADWFGAYGFTPEFLSNIWLPREKLAGIEVPRLQLLAGISNPIANFAFFILTMVAALFTTLGLWSKASSIALAIGVVSIHHRNPMILHGGDVVMRVMVLYIALAPSGLAYSLDSWRARKRALASEASEEVPTETVPIVPLWTQRLIAYNTSLVYLTTVWLKWGGDLWRNGMATYYPNRLQEFERFPIPEFLKNSPFVQITTWGTLLVEFGMVSLVYYRPLRKYCLLGGIMMHMFIEYSMNIPVFSFLMICSYLSFYDGEETRAFVDRVRARFLKPKSA